MSQKEGETIFLVTLWSLISRRSVQNIMRIFWVSRIYTQNGPQNILIWTWKAKATCHMIFVIIRAMTKIFMQNFMKKYSTILKIKEKYLKTLSKLKTNQKHTEAINLFTFVKINLKCSKHLHNKIPLTL